MLRNVVRAVTILGCAMYPMWAQADVQPSEQMKEVLRAQAERAQRGDENLDEFRNALRPPAESGDPVAQFMLGTLLLQQDRDGAVKLMRSSAEKGCAGAAGVLALHFLDQDSSDAGHWLRQAVEGGDAAAMMIQSSLLYRGEHGYERNVSEALAWAQLAKARSHNRGLSKGLEQFVQKLQGELSEQQIADAAALLQELERKHPEKAIYLCGQSAP